MRAPSSFLSQQAATEELTEQVTALLQSLPTGTNPFPYLRKSMHDQLVSSSPAHTRLAHPASHPAFKRQLQALSGILAIVAVVLAVGLIVKAARKTLWIFRIDEHHGRMLIVPHYLNSFSLFTCFGVALMQGFIWSTIDFIDANGSPSNFPMWKTILWLPAWLAYWFSAWSLLVSHVTHKEATGDRRRWYSSAWFLNCYGLGVCIFLILSVTITSALANNHFEKAFEAYDQLDAAFAQASEAWNGTIDLASLHAAAELGGFILSEISIFINLFRATFAMYVVGGVFKQGTFCGVAFWHLRTLRETMKEVSAGHTLPTPREQAIQKELQRQYRNLTFVTVLFTVTTTLFEALFLFTLADADKIVTDGLSNEAASLMALYIYAILGLPISLVLLRASFDRTPDHEPINGSNEVRESKVSQHGAEVVTRPQVIHLQPEDPAYTPGSPPELGFGGQHAAQYQSYPSRTSGSPAEPDYSLGGRPAQAK
ncbi:hypothetical protein T439DRAFT_353328 [Meredithblackwellia eburnea MCA 4105]